MIDKTAIIDPTAQIADDAIIGPYVVIGKNVKIGSGTRERLYDFSICNNRFGASGSWI